MPQLMRLFERLGEYVRARPSLLSWTRRLTERYQERMGHRRLGIHIRELRSSLF
jgi:hypothetical protein